MNDSDSGFDIVKVFNSTLFLLYGTVLIVTILLLFKDVNINKKIMVKFFKIIKYTGYCVISIACLFVIRSLVNLSFEDAAKQLLSAFGFLALLSSLCFSLTTHTLDPNNKLITLKAGKRFMLSAVLLVFCTFLSYLYSHSHIVRTNTSITWFRDVIAYSLIVLIVILGIALTILVFQGYTIIYNYLWETFDTAPVTSDSTELKEK